MVHCINMSNKSKKQSRRRKSLNQFLNDVINRAKRNTHKGAARSADLEKELVEIAKQVYQTLEQINKEAEMDTSIEASSKVASKLERTTQLLTSELMRLSAIYHRQIDTARIRSFLTEQQELIRTSMDDGTEASLTLDGRITELHKLMAEERARISKAVHVERNKFFISVSIALLSLALSIYALWFR